jgi:hypothetical protein
MFPKPGNPNDNHPLFVLESVHYSFIGLAYQGKDTIVVVPWRFQHMFVE